MHLRDDYNSHSRNSRRKASSNKDPIRIHDRTVPYIDRGSIAKLELVELEDKHIQSINRKAALRDSPRPVASRTPIDMRLKDDGID